MKNIILAAAAATMLAGCGSSSMPLNPTNAHSNVFIRSRTQSHVFRHDVKCWRCVPCYFDASTSNILLPGIFTRCYLQGEHPTPTPLMTTEVGPLVYASQFIGSDVVVYAQQDSSAPVARITDGIRGPQGLFVDANEDLFVANTMAHNVLVFHKGSLKAYRVLDDAGEWPVSVAVDTDGTVYVANIHDNDDGPGTVSVYANGSSSPNIIGLMRNFKVLSLALDADHDLFVGYAIDGAHLSATSKFGRVAELSANNLLVKNVTSRKWYMPGGIEIDGQGQLIVPDQGRLALHSHLGVSTYIFQDNRLLSTLGTDMFSAMAEALNSDQQTVWAADSILGTLNEYTYPSGTLMQSINDNVGQQGVWVGDPPYGIAIDPAATPGVSDSRHATL